MANKRQLKKAIAYACGEMAGECFFAQNTFENTNPEEWDKLFFNSRGYSTLTNYIRKKLFEQDDLYELMCKSCDNCSFFKAGRNKCVNLPICLNAVEIHADDSERKLNQRLN